MTKLNTSKDYIPMVEFKNSPSKWLMNVQKTGHPLIITEDGEPAGVLISPSEYDDLVYKKSFLTSIENGISDSSSGNTFSTEELKEKLQKNRDIRKN